MLGMESVIDVKLVRKSTNIKAVFQSIKNLSVAKKLNLDVNSVHIKPNNMEI